MPRVRSLPGVRTTGPKPQGEGRGVEWVMADAVPLPWELFAPPRTGPRVAQGHVDAVIVDATRPRGDHFRIRVYAAEFPPPPDDIVAAWVFYGVGAASVVASLRDGWSSAGPAPAREAQSNHFAAFDFRGGLAPAVAAIERLAGAFPP